ncbi:unnamed protein product [Plutella xylostella]|uniref:(diamondback moth) hypothetical protein n=1 Tax=Plutella xylostella TaxID=51655 RepID=A0A8S4G4M9_PLUXY|nr:unnamed protein product [Plutella xylostella]
MTAPNRCCYTTVDPRGRGQCHEPLRISIARKTHPEGNIGKIFSRDEYKSLKLDGHSISHLQAVEVTTAKMKSLVCVLLLVAIVAAEPPLFQPPSRTQRLEFRRDAEDSSKEPTTEKAAEAVPNNVDTNVGGAPYPASGFRPVVPFSLPPRAQASPPGTSYGLPADSYGPPLFSFVGPPSWYGAPAKAEEKPEEPKPTEAEAEPTTTTEEPTTAKPEETTVAATTEKAPERATGAYYVLLPGPQLQRIVFSTENDVTNMAYTAQIQYKSEDRGPIFVYSPASPAAPAAPAAQYGAPNAAYTTYQLAPAYQYQWR